MTVSRTDFATNNPELAEDLIRRAYMDQRLSISGVAAEFEFSHHSVGVTGPGSIRIDEWSNSMRMRLDAEPLDDVLIAESLHHGLLGLENSSDFEDLHLRPGQVLLGPPTGGHTGLSDNTVMTLCLLNHTQVAQHAAARCGIDPASLRFTSVLSPISPRHGQVWTSTVAHVRDDILADPTFAAEPIILDHAFRLLATTMLATFANSALAATTDPLTSAAGQLGADVTDQAVDYIRDHAGEPVTPADVAADVGAPTRHIDDALRRRRNTTLAQQLWAARMQGAYRDLYDGHPSAGDSVAAIAARWGFVSAATFTAAYTLSTGGETPEDTLRR